MKNYLYHEIYKNKNLKLNYFFTFIFLFISFYEAKSQSGWIHQDIGTEKFLVTNFINNTTGYILSEDKTILRTTNAGISWNLIPSNIINPRLVKNGSFISDSVYVLHFTAEMYFTINGGNSWNYSFIAPQGAGVVGLYGIDVLNSQTAYVCGYDFGTSESNFYLDGIIYKTTNSGANWFESQRGGNVYRDINFKNSTTGYVCNAAIIHTTNAGTSWTYLNGLGSWAISISNIFNDTLYLSSDSGQVFRTINAGLNWTKYYTPSHDTLNKIFFVNSRLGYAVGTNGTIVMTSNAGESWNLQNSGTTRDLHGIWFINQDTGFVVGDSGLVLKTISGGILLSVNNNNEVSPGKFILFQNYPNPYNPKTIIKYQLLTADFVSLKVYNVTGNEITTLVKQKQNPGIYSIDWNAENFPSGIYFYTINAGDFKQTKRMILLK